MGLTETITALGGVASVGQLARRGFSPQYVRGAYRRHGIERVRRGWYAGADADPGIVRSARVGGTLTCVSACAHYGLWTPPTDSIHVSVPSRSRHLKHPLDGSPIERSGAGIVLHWSGVHGDETSFVAGTLSIRNCLLEVLRCLPEDFAFAVIESALARGLVDRVDIEWLGTKTPSRSRLLAFARADAGSGTESIFRYRMNKVGVSMQSQVEISGIGRVDFLIGDRLIVEIDSHEHHNSPHHRLRDLDRDAVAVSLDYVPLRFDYVQVMSDWEAVASTVWAVVERGDHFRARPIIAKTDF
jgi:very-short-patch-repair endonuclease